MKTEIFDIYDESLQPIGTATREDTHANGYWHRTFHCWIYERQHDDIMIAFQQRQASKDTNPLHYDITVAGHLTAGETVQDAVREIQEEIGVTVSFDRLQYVMRAKEESYNVHNGIVYHDCEYSEVFALENPLSISSWVFQPSEVLAVYTAPLRSLHQLFIGEIEELQVTGYKQSADATLHMDQHTAIITKEQFVPRDLQYYLRVLQAIASL